MRLERVAIIHGVCVKADVIAVRTKCFLHSARSRSIRQSESVSIITGILWIPHAIWEDFFDSGRTIQLGIQHIYVVQNLKVLAEVFIAAAFSAFGDPNWFISMKRTDCLIQKNRESIWIRRNV